MGAVCDLRWTDVSDRGLFNDKSSYHSNDHII